jgi:ABC-type polar amino acid transport system ATPase subunit
MSPRIMLFDKLSSAFDAEMVNEVLNVMIDATTYNASRSAL